MAIDSEEKSPIEPSDYQGLQLDTRARDTTENNVDPEKESMAEVEIRALARLPRSSLPSTVESSRTSHAASPKEKRIYGLRRQVFWVILALILIIIILAAVVGGVVGASKHGTSTLLSTPSSTPPSTPTGAASSNKTDVNNGKAPESQSNVMVGSPLAMLAYARNSTNGDLTNGTGPSEQQSIRLFFQSAHGNIKSSGYDGVLAPWRDANPIFTDALNNTGLCVFTYQNGTEQSFAIYYIGVNGLVQEKRASLSKTTFLPSTLNKLNLKAAGNTSVSRQDLNTESSSWNFYRMAVVYSTDFYDGPGARLFYHFLAENGTTWVQEMIWNQNSDVWSEGAMLNDPWPSSHLAAIIDETGKTLRLFYSAGNLTLQESYLNIADANATYGRGINIPDLLIHDDGDLAAVAVNGNALVYHYSNQTTLSIRELNISGTPGSRSSPEMYDLSNEKIVAQPALLADGQVALYQPIGAVLTKASGAEPRIYVSWAEQITATNSSYSTLAVVSRRISEPDWPNSTHGKGEGQVEVPLGNYNVDPSV